MDKETTNKIHLLLIAGLIFIILLLSFYSIWQGPRHELLYKKAILNLDTYQGQTLSLSYAYIKKVKGNLLFARQFNTIVPAQLQKPSSSLKKGQFISFAGALNPQGIIEIQTWHLHKNRRLKYWISLIPFLLILSYSIKTINKNIKKTNA